MRSWTTEEKKTISVAFLISMMCQCHRIKTHNERCVSHTYPFWWHPRKWQFLVFFFNFFFFLFHLPSPFMSLRYHPAYRRIYYSLHFEHQMDFISWNKTYTAHTRATSEWSQSVAASKRNAWTMNIHVQRVVCACVVCHFCIPYPSPSFLRTSIGDADTLPQARWQTENQNNIWKSQCRRRKNRQWTHTVVTHKTHSCKRFLHLDSMCLFHVFFICYQKINKKYPETCVQCAITFNVNEIQLNILEVCTRKMAYCPDVKVPLANFSALLACVRRISLPFGNCERSVNVFDYCIQYIIFVQYHHRTCSATVYKFIVVDGCPQGHCDKPNSLKCNTVADATSFAIPNMCVCVCVLFSIRYYIFFFV